MNIGNKILPYIVVLTVVVLLSACGGKSSIVTVDDSADYQSAKALPPLKKDIGNKNRANNRVNKGAATTSGLVTADARPQPSSQVPNDSGSRLRTALLPSVVDDNDRYARLMIDAPVDEAWLYIADRLQGSDLTVHRRNKSSNQFLIGCLNIEPDATTANSQSSKPKKTRWTLFNRNKKQPSEYCALQLKAVKKKTLVSVFDRAGEETNRDAAKQLFSRILNK